MGEFGLRRMFDMVANVHIVEEKNRVCVILWFKEVFIMIYFFNIELYI